MAETPRREYELSETVFQKREEHRATFDLIVTLRRTRARPYVELPERWKTWLGYMAVICAAIRPRIDGRHAGNTAVHMAQTDWRKKPQDFSKLGTVEQFRKDWRDGELDIWIDRKERRIMVRSTGLREHEENAPGDDSPEDAKL